LYFWRLGIEIVKIYHGEKAAEKAASEFKRFFAEKIVGAAKLPLVAFDARPVALLDLVFEIKTQSKKSISRSEARRLIEQGGVSIDGDVSRDPRHVVTPAEGMVVRIGKKDFFRIAVR
jgi:tyrosyl-tRNA synthetase